MKETREKYIQRVANEIATLQACQHPNVVSFLDCYAIDDEFWVRNLSLFFKTHALNLVNHGDLHLFFFPSYSHSKRNIAMVDHYKI